MAGLLALAGSASVGLGISQAQRAAVGSTSMTLAGGGVVAASKAGLSSWDRARLGACVVLAGASEREQHSELDRRAECADQLGLDPSSTQ